MCDDLLADPETPSYADKLVGEIHKGCQLEVDVADTRFKQFKKLLKDAFTNKLPEQVLKRKDKVGFSTDDDLLLKTKIDEIISDVNNLEPNSVIDKKIS